MSDKIVEIQESLAMVTQGKWESTGTGVEVDTGEPLSRGYARVANLYGILHSNNPNHENDSQFIANAPEYVRFLLTELDKRDEEIRKLWEDKEKLIKGLRWYAAWARTDLRMKEIFKEIGVME